MLWAWHCEDPDCGERPLVRSRGHLWVPTQAVLSMPADPPAAPIGEEDGAGAWSMREDRPS